MRAGPQGTVSVLGAGAELFDEEPGSPRRRCAGEQRREGSSVRIVHPNACPGGEGWGEVGVEGDPVLPPGLHARSPDDEGHPDVLLVGGGLARPEPVLAHVVALVRGEDDVSVVQLAPLSEYLDEVPDRLVNGEQGTGPVPVPALQTCLLLIFQAAFSRHP